MVRIRLFASLRDQAGRPEITVAIDRPIPLREFWDRLDPLIPGVMDWVKKKRILVAVNEEMATDETLIRDGDEVGLMPPFSGGAEPHTVRNSERNFLAWTRIQTDDFSLDEELRRIKAVSGRIGGVAFFVGTGRDFSKGRSVKRLTYEHYSGPAERTLAGIRGRAIEQFGVIEVCIIHRTGDILVGGNIVLVAAAAEHRAEAFRACRWCIDELKATVPIWKKETTPEGDVWVDEHP